MAIGCMPIVEYKGCLHVLDALWHICYIEWGIHGNLKWNFGVLR